MSRAKMRGVRLGLMAAVVLSLAALAPSRAEACGKCHQNPCVVAQPAYTCVTEMVPYTVMKTRKRIEYQPVTETIMVRVPETTWVERQRVVCRPVYDTTYVQRQVCVRKPVYETEMVSQTYTVCRPVTTTRQVTAVCMQPTTQYVTVPARNRCSLCGLGKPACGCITVAQTCYTPVTVVRDVVETHMVQETATRQVPVTRCRIVTETKIENVPVTQCRMVQEVVTDRIPVTRFHCEPKTVTRHVPVPVCETVPVTCYRPVKRMVPCNPAPAPVAYAVATEQAPMPAPQAAPSGQAGASAQH